jgi:hypothetical protein
VNYVIGGYSAALATLFVYAVGLGLRRRRWERAFKNTEASGDEVASGGRP